MLIRLKQRKKIKPRTKLNHNSLFDLSCSPPRVISFPFSEWARRGRGEVMKTRLLFANMSPASFLHLTVLFKNTWILKFKSQLMFVFLAAVNHLSGPLRNQKFTSMGSKLICDWWILIRFVCFCVSRFIARDRNYDWPQQKMKLWRRLLKCRIHVFLKSPVSWPFSIVHYFSCSANYAFYTHSFSFSSQ